MNHTLIKPNALFSTKVFLWRSLLKIKSAPGQMIFDAVAAIISMLLFTFLFGGAINGSPQEYVQFLLPGMLFMTVLPMTVYAGAALGKDIATGVYDRFRTLGFWQPAPVMGTLMGEVVKYAIAVIAVTLTGIAIGFRPAGGITGILVGMLLAVLYAFSLSWIFAAWGVAAGKPDNVAQNSMLFLYTSIFCSNIFTDTATMPGWIQRVIQFNPTTHIATKLKEKESSVMLGDSIQPHHPHCDGDKGTYARGLFGGRVGPDALRWDYHGLCAVDIYLIWEKG